MNSGGGRTETFWHLCILVTILVVATCVRFYSLDQISLSANELANLNICNAQGWMGIVTEYRSHTGMPPLYPALLCEFASLTSSTEFFVRTFSAIAGLLTIYIIYVTGRDFLSTGAGLLAAAVMATNFHQAIVFNRETDYASLLMMVFFMHSYCFCRLFFFRNHNNNTHRPLVIRFAGTQSQFQWTWQPDFPSDGRNVVAFWITGALLFYTSHTSLILLGAEFIASIALVTAYISPTLKRTTLLRALWLPLLITTLPWLPTLYGFKDWILTGHLFAFQSMSTLWQKLQPFLPIYPFMLKCLVALIVIFTSLLIITKLLNKKDWLDERFIAYVFFQLLLALFSLWLISANNYSSLLYFWWIFILILMAPISIALDSIPYDPIKKWIFGLTILAIIIVQVTFNAQHKLYSANGNVEDFRLAVKIIHDDKNFMNGNRNVVMSSDLFEPYLAMYEITNHNVTLLDKEVPHENTSFGNSEFYYLEYLPRYKNFDRETPALQALSRQYQTLCVTKIPWMRIVKFSRDTASATNEGQDCRSHSDKVSLQ